MLAEAVTQDDAAEVIDHFVSRPAEFVEEILGGELWDIPRAILEALAKPRARIAIKGCNRSSKTWTLGKAVAWFVTTGGRVLTTAPTAPQVELIWREIREAHAQSRYPLGGEMLTHEWKLGHETLAIGRATDKSERIQGINFPKLLIIVDESPGVRPPVFEAIEGIRSGGDVRVVMLGNPTITSGPYYEAFTKDRSGWLTFTISAFDTPNLKGLTARDLRGMSEAELAVSVNPDIVTRAWVKEKLDECGEDHPFYQARVLAQFPSDDPQALIALTWAEAAKAREMAPLALDAPIDAGVDVGGPGEDESVVYLRSGSSVITMHVFTDADARGSIARVLGLVKDRLRHVNVDEIGIGYHVVTHLRDLGFPVTGINVGASPVNRERFANLKAELYWALRERFQGGDIAGVTDERTIAQLTGIKWGANSAGQTIIESKEQARKRGLKSPDRAEALMLAFAPSSDHAAAFPAQFKPRPRSASVFGGGGGIIFPTKGK